MTDVAIVGMSCILPGAEDLDAYRDNLLAGADAISAVPEGRWEAEFYDPDSHAVDRIYCNRGGFIDDFARVDPLRWGLMPRAVEGAEPDQMLVLETAGRALADAGIDAERLPRERTGVALGRGGYMTPAIRRYSQASTHVLEVTAAVRSLVPGIDESRIENIRRQYLEHLPDMTGGNVIGLVPNLAASRIANRLDLQGPAYTVDAACASSLLAVDQACSELIRRRCDVMLAGGVHVGMGPAFWSVFCQLGALSRSERCRPFHRDADGLLIGEGVGMVVLKRLEDAERDGDRIYAVIRGTGVSSDGREASVMNPRAAGQSLSVKRAWDMAGLDPREPGVLGFLEAHGTATGAGDAAEIETLLDVFGPRLDGRAEAGLGSVKSMIGHAMPAAGIAGLIKAALAVHHRTLLPTLHCDEPREEVEASRFRPVAQAEPWDAPGGAPRRAGVNAFGFGGINAHVVLEEARGSAGAARGPGVAFEASPERSPVLLLTGERPEDLLRGLDEGRSRVDGGPLRLAVLDPTPERLERARKVVGLGKPFRDRKGHVWFTPEGEIARGGKVAFLYPGLDSGPPLGIDEVARAFGRPELPDHDPHDLEQLAAAIVVSGDVLTNALHELGVEPDFLGGHSIGEWTAMIAAHSIPREAVTTLLRTVAPGQLELPDVAFGSVGAGAERIEAFVDAGVTVALDNCPHQAVICGPTEAVRDAMDRLRSEGILCQELSFRSGFHSPHLAEYLEPIEAHVREIEFRSPDRSIWSATTCRPFPRDPSDIRELFLEHLLRPVRFRELVLALHDAGARVFVQLGHGSLVGFIDDTLKGTGHAAVPALAARVPPIEQLRRLVVALWVEGLDVRVERLMTPIGLPAPSRNGAKGMALDLTTPLGKVRETLGWDPAASVDLGDAANDPVVAEFDATARALEAARRDVLAAWKRRRDAGPALEPRARRTVRRISLETYPELLHHSLFPLPRGWPTPEDGFPVVPMTMSLALMMDAARDLVPERTVVAVEDVRAFQWMAVDEPLDLEVDATFDGADLVEVRLGPYVQGNVRLAAAYEPPPAPTGPFEGEVRIDETAREMYDNRLMFHGPDYQALIDLGAWCEEGIRGRVRALPAKGSLLDGCGQVLGYWIRNRTVEDRLAFPVMIDALRFYGPEPGPGEELDCKVWVRHFGRAQVRCDMEIVHEGRVWAVAEGWQDRRIPNEEWMWPVIHYPEKNTLSETLDEAPDVCWLRTPIESRALRNSFARRYLGQTGFRAWDALPEGPRRIDWLAGRIAAKDAVRRRLWRNGEGSIFPVEIGILTGPKGEPRVSSSYVPELHVSIAHRDGHAAAIVGEDGPVGIDLERVEPRTEAFDQVAFAPEERSLLPDEDRDGWRTRFWAAKEAVAKSLGTGLDGSPREFPIERIEGETIFCRGRRVHTLRVDEWVLAWTTGENER